MYLSGYFIKIFDFFKPVIYKAINSKSNIGHTTQKQYFWKIFFTILHKGFSYIYIYI